MRLGLSMGYSAAAATIPRTSRWPRRRTGSATRSAWVAEAYGSDAPTVLSLARGARPSAIDVGSAVMQIPGRTPAMTAMTAATLDRCRGGRFRLGLGVSGPQVSEGWHGVRFDKPLARTREYVDDRPAGARAARRCSTTASTSPLPLPDGPGKALRLAVHPVRDADPDLPRRGRPEEPGAAPARSPTAGWRSSSRPSTPRSRSRTIDDGPRQGRARRCDELRRRADRAGRRRRRRPQAAPTRSAGTPRSTSAGWAAAEQNFYNQLAVRMGYERGGQARCRTCTSTGDYARRRRRCRSSSSTGPLLGTGRADRRADAAVRGRRRHHAVA